MWSFLRLHELMVRPWWRAYLVRVRDSNIGWARSRIAVFLSDSSANMLYYRVGRVRGVHRRLTGDLGRGNLKVNSPRLGCEWCLVTLNG